MREYFAAGVPEGNLLEHALGSAALHGRRGVVEFLLGKGPDLSFTDPSFGVTARGAASYAGHTEIVALIDERLASSRGYVSATGARAPGRAGEACQARFHVNADRD